MRHLLDRSNLLELVRSKDGSPPTRMNTLMCEIVLRADGDPAEEVGALIEQEEATGHFPPFAQRARRRLAERLPSQRALAGYLGRSDPGLTLRVHTHLMPSSRERPARPWLPSSARPKTSRYGS
ncbi:hypothetical protein ACFV29_22930 [Streptomyces sp. NPDC059690]|uniref:hypothetical protein n=1 Tax=Streptomyces sp. NPDC059690 TaxID=3346907 RepID=UPI003682E9F0